MNLTEYTVGYVVNTSSLESKVMIRLLQTTDL